VGVTGIVSVVSIEKNCMIGVDTTTITKTETAMGTNMRMGITIPLTAGNTKSNKLTPPTHNNIISPLQRVLLMDYGYANNASCSYVKSPEGGAGGIASGSRLVRRSRGRG
jgi:hypothetical protein